MPNQTLKTAAHSLYDPAFADWDATVGCARFGSEKTIDIQLPGKLILPSRTLYVSMIMAKTNPYIVFPTSAYIYAGFWLNNGVDSYWIQGQNPFTLTGTVVGTVPTGQQRKYKVFARTDRATSFLSTEVTFNHAPTDTDFADGCGVNLAWDRLGDIGIISYDVYRYTTTGGVYVLLAQVESGANTYLDNNSYLTTVAGYPTPTDDRSTALTTTRTLTTESVLNNLFIDGVSTQWSTLSFPIPIPYGYDAGSPAVAGNDGLQWFRLGIGGVTGAPDLQLPDVVVTSGTDLFSALALFESTQVGLDILLIGESADYTTTIASFVDDENITITDAVPDGTYTIYITGGGGNHCLLVDCLHCSFGDGATYGANDNDLTPPRPQFPRAAPNGSTQGGTGIGGGPTDGGGPLCVEVNEPMVTLYGNERMQKRIGDISVGEVVESGNLQPNVVATIPRKFWCENIWHLATENGCSLNASPSHPVYRNRLDKNGTPMEMLTTKMKVLTCNAGVYEQSQVTNIEPTGRGSFVAMISCTPSPSFVAGNCESGVGGIVCHNSKPADVPVSV